ncbi:MAG TPA: TMEM175 family protein [Acidobacteriaceae bacterium]|nr:TMEM175 family protein [Acidobacteriaceae bacterium]
MPGSLTRSRLDSFSDGVIAVIITIMVLELKVPGTREMGDRAALLINARIFGVYLLSFVQVGIYWVNHHYLLDDLETVTHGILWANLGLLFTLSLIPFGIQWIGTRGIAPLPVAVYSVCFCLPALAWTVLAHVIRLRTHIPPAASFSKQTVSSLLNLGAVFMAFYSPWAALAMIAAVAVMWLVPPRRILEKTRVVDSSTTPSRDSA